MKKTKYVWGVWLAITLGLLGFWEGFGHLFGGVTLSEAVWDMQDKYPPTGFLVGGVAMALLAHFFWNRGKK